MTDEQRSQTGCIGVQESVVILARALSPTKDYRLALEDGSMPAVGADSDRRNARFQWTKFRLTAKACSHSIELGWAIEH